MYRAIPPEMIGGAVQLAIYFITAIGVVIGLMMTARA